MSIAVLGAALLLSSPTVEAVKAPVDCAMYAGTAGATQANPYAAWVRKQCQSGKAGKADAAAKGAFFGGSDVNLVTGDETFPAVTQAGSSLATDDGSNVVAVYTDTRDAMDSFSGMSVSTDGGITFERLDPNPFLTEFAGDVGAPSVAWDASLSTWLAAVPTSACGAQGIGVMTSATPETSASWSAATCPRTGTADDRPVLWVDNGGGFVGRRYIAFNDFAVNSGALKLLWADGVGAWSEVTVNDGSTTFYRNVQLTGDASGNLYLFAMDEGGGGANPRTNVVFTSTDGGSSWSMHAMGNAFNGPGSGLCADSDYFQMLSPNWRQMGWGQGAAGPDGVVHYVYARKGQFQDDYGDIYYTRSVDGGVTWSGGIPLNTDQLLNNYVVQWQPSISVTEQNHVLVGWYDRRNTTDGLNYQYFGRLSLDGGLTWNIDKPISDRLIPQPSQVDPAMSFCFAGESNFHVANTSDSFVAWSDGRNAILNTQDPAVEEPQLDVYFKRVPLCPVVGVAPAVLPNAQQGEAYDQSASASGGSGGYTYTLSGVLPDGLGLDTGNGQISGTPTAAGIYSFAVVAVDDSGCEGSQPYSLIVDPPPAASCPAITLDPGTLLDGAQGASFDQTVTASGGAAPYSYVVTAGSLPLGVQLDPDTGQLFGVPQESQGFSFSITATDANDCTGTQAYSTSIACPTITLSPPSQLVDGIAGVPFLTRITANGGTAPYKFFVEGGTEPKGAYIAEGGTVFGVLESPGTKQPRIKAIDANGCESGLVRFRLDASKCPNGAIFCADSFDLVEFEGDTGDFTATATCGSEATWHATGACASSNDIGHTPTALARWGNPTPDAGDTNNPNCANYGTVDEPGQGVLQSTEFDVSQCNGGAVLLDFNYILGFQSTDLSDRARVIAVADGGTAEVVADNGPHAAACAAPDSPGLGNLKPFSGWQHIQLEVPAESTFQFSFVGETENGDRNAGEGFLIDDVLLRCKCPDDFEMLPETLEPAQVDVGYVTTFETTGGVPPYSYGTLPGNPTPAGMTLDAVSGVLSGTPTTPGIFSFTVESFDSNFCSIRRIYNMIISPANCPAFTFDPESLSDGIVGDFFAETVTATGGTDPLAYSVTEGVLPPGLSLNPSTGTVSGTPTEPDIYDFTIGVVDANLCVASFDYNTTIAPLGCPAIGLTPTLLPNAMAGQSYGETISASGGDTPYQWTVTGGVLPAGLSLDPANGSLNGTPTSGGTFSFEVTAQDANLCPGTQSYDLTVVGCPVIEVTPTTIANPVQGAAYSVLFGASGGTAPYSFDTSAGSVPSGLSLNPDTGELSGIPTTQGSFSFTIAAQDNVDCSGVRAYSVVVGAAPCPTISLAPAAITNEGVVGQAYNQPILASGGVGPYTYSISAGALPPGLVINDDPNTIPIEADGLISGTPTSAGVFNFQVTANDANGCAGIRDYSLIINNAGCPEILISPGTLPGATEDAAYSAMLTASGGAGPYTWSLSSGSLPTGLSLNTATGEISGTPVGGGDFVFEVRAEDSNGCFSVRAVSLNVSSIFGLYGIFRDGFEGSAP